MQRQAVPLINPQSPTVGTGIEGVIAKNSSQLVRRVAETGSESAGRASSHPCGVPGTVWPCVGTDPGAGRRQPDRRPYS